MSSTLHQAVEESMAAFEHRPRNEQETCSRVIYPLLLAMGYAHHEIQQQAGDAGNQRPDYTILPGEKGLTWFLEAKAWSSKLDEKAALQGVTYATRNANRWVVVSNGQEWQLYDNKDLAQVQDKLVCTAKLKDPDFVSFLEALSKQSILENRLEAFVRNRKLYAHLTAALKEPKSAEVVAMQKVLKKVSGLENVTGDQIVQFLKDGFRAPAIAEPLEAPPSVTTEVVAPSEAMPVPEKSGATTEKLANLSKPIVKGMKPIHVRFEDGDERQTKHWIDIVILVADWLNQRNALPQLPFFGSDNVKRPLLALKGSEAALTIHTPREMPPPLSHIVVEKNQSSSTIFRNTRLLLGAAGYSTDNVMVTFAPEYPDREPVPTPPGD